MISVGYAAPKRGLLVLKSAIVPGWGQIESKHNSGYVLLANEILLLSGKTYYQEEKRLYVKKAKQYAEDYAGVSKGSKTGSFWIDLGKYDSSGFGPKGYSEMLKKEAMALYPYDVEAQESYITERQYNADQQWNWESSDQRLKYKSFRSKSRDSYDYAKNLTGVLIANHLLSTVQMLLIQKQQNVQLGMGMNSEKAPLVTMEFRF